MYVVFVRKAGKVVCVFRHSAMQVGRYSDIEHRMRGIRQDVCVTFIQFLVFIKERNAATSIQIAASLRSSQ